jgi:small neutral amino acid transporter SnatA (MarC family)
MLLNPNDLTGIYLVLFCRCMYIFYRGKRQTVLLITAIIMFSLSTTMVIIFLLQGASAYGTLGLEIDKLEVAGAIVYVTNK